MLILSFNKFVGESVCKVEMILLIDKILDDNMLFNNEWSWVWWQWTQLFGSHHWNYLLRRKHVLFVFGSLLFLFIGFCLVDFQDALRMLMANVLLESLIDRLAVLIVLFWLGFLLTILFILIFQRRFYWLNYLTLTFV